VALNLSAADAVLKEDYKGPVVSLLNNGNVMLAQIERNSEDIVGRRWVAPLHTGRNSGVGARAEGGTLPTAGNQQYVDSIGPVRYMYARIQLTGPVIAAMSKDRGAFIRGVKPEMEGAVSDGKRDYCRQVWGESNGRIATCGVTAASTTVVLASTTRADQLRHLAEGFLITIGTLADPTSVATERSIVSVNVTAKTFVISGAVVTTAATDFIFRSGAGGASDASGNPGDGQIELTGLQTIVSDTAVLHTVNPATTTKWKAGVLTNPAGAGTNRSISENLVNQALMAQEIESGHVVELLVGSDGVYRSYSNVLTSLKRMMDTVELKGGYAGVSVGTQQMGKGGAKSLALTWDRDCPNNQLFGVRPSDLTFYELQDWDWIDPNNNGTVLTQVGETDAYSATLKKYGEQVCRRRNTHFVIKDITEQ
jgi:hypothetical protein